LRTCVGPTEGRQQKIVLVLLGFLGSGLTIAGGPTQPPTQLPLPGVLALIAIGSGALYLLRRR